MSGTPGSRIPHDMGYFSHSLPVLPPSALLSSVDGFLFGQLQDAQASYGLEMGLVSMS